MRQLTIFIILQGCFGTSSNFIPEKDKSENTFVSDDEIVLNQLYLSIPFVGILSEVTTIDDVQRVELVNTSSSQPKAICSNGKHVDESNIHEHQSQNRFNIEGAWSSDGVAHTNHSCLYSDKCLLILEDTPITSRLSNTLAEEVPISEEHNCISMEVTQATHTSKADTQSNILYSDTNNDTISSNFTQIVGFLDPGIFSEIEDTSMCYSDVNSLSPSIQPLLDNRTNENTPLKSRIDICKFPDVEISYGFTLLEPILLNINHQKSCKCTNNDRKDNLIKKRTPIWHPNKKMKKNKMCLKRSNPQKSSKKANKVQLSTQIITLAFKDTLINPPIQTSNPEQAGFVNTGLLNRTRIGKNIIDVLDDLTVESVVVDLIDVDTRKEIFCSIDTMKICYIAVKLWKQFAMATIITMDNFSVFTKSKLEVFYYFGEIKTFLSFDSYYRKLISDFNLIKLDAPIKSCLHAEHNIFLEQNWLDDTTRIFSNSCTKISMISKAALVDDLIYAVLIVYKKCKLLEHQNIICFLFYHYPSNQNNEDIVKYILRYKKLLVKLIVLFQCFKTNKMSQESKKNLEWLELKLFNIQSDFLLASNKYKSTHAIRRVMTIAKKHIDSLDRPSLYVFLYDLIGRKRGLDDLTSVHCMTSSNNITKPRIKLVLSCLYSRVWTSLSKLTSLNNLIADHKHLNIPESYENVVKMYFIN